MGIMCYIIFTGKYGNINFEMKITCLKLSDLLILKVNF